MNIPARCTFAQVSVKTFKEPVTLRATLPRSVGPLVHCLLRKVGSVVSSVPVLAVG